MREGFLEAVTLELGKEGGFLGGRNRTAKAQHQQSAGRLDSRVQLD